MISLFNWRILSCFALKIKFFFSFFCPFLPGLKLFPDQTRSNFFLFQGLSASSQAPIYVTTFWVPVQVFFCSHNLFLAMDFHLSCNMKLFGVQPVLPVNGQGIPRSISCKVLVWDNTSYRKKKPTDTKNTFDSWKKVFSLNWQALTTLSYPFLKWC